MASNFFSQLGTASAGLGSALKNLYTMPSQVAQAEAQARMRSAQEAQLRQAMLRKDEAQDAINLWAENAGIDKRLVAGTSDPTEIMNRLRANAQMRGYKAAGMLDPVVQQVINKVQQNQASLPQASSYSEDANVTPSIASLKLKGNNSYQEAPPPDNQSVRNQVQENTMRNGALLRQIIQDTGAIENALKGNGMYQSTPNGGYFNKFYGDGGVYDDVARAIYQNDKQSQIANRENQITNRNERTRLAKNRESRIKANAGKRGGGHRGGGHRYKDEYRNGVYGQVDTVTGRFHPYRESMQGNSGSRGEGGASNSFKDRPSGWTAQDEAALQRGDARYFSVDKEDF